MRVMPAFRREHRGDGIVIIGENEIRNPQHDLGVKA
jgi:hypothetical protein